MAGSDPYLKFCQDKLAAATLVVETLRPAVNAGNKEVLPAFDEAQTVESHWRKLVEAQT